MTCENNGTGACAQGRRASHCDCSHKTGSAEAGANSLVRPLALILLALVIAALIL